MKDIGDGKWLEAVEKMKEMQLDIVGIGEPCINWRLKLIKQQYLQPLLSTFRTSSLIVSTIQTTHDKLYLPGGTATVTVGFWNSKISKQLYDTANMGRWTGASYTLSDSSQLHIITAYRVCETKIKSAKSLSAYAQQYAALKSKGFDQPDPRQQMLLDLNAFIKTLQITESDYFMLAIDANNSTGNGTEALTDILTDSNLVDMYMERHQDYEQFSTHENGTKKIDYLFCTRNLMRYVLQVGYMHYDEAFESDHRAIFCDIDKNILANNEEPQYRAKD
jgi:hypothetical protein